MQTTCEVLLKPTPCWVVGVTAPCNPVTIAPLWHHLHFEVLADWLSFIPLFKWLQLAQRLTNMEPVALS
ncbi:hypothetical protein H0W26_01890 [Candidatus Dependentiae bacterium]|nr:hypothetical protein [Candidatus Dependentiae bacterium]